MSDRINASSSGQQKQNEEDNDEWEEVLVVATIANMDETLIFQNASQIQIEDLDGSKPTLVVDNTLKFKGTFERVLGTKLLFSVSDENPEMSAIVTKRLKLDLVDINLEGKLASPTAVTVIDAEVGDSSNSKSAEL